MASETVDLGFLAEVNEVRLTWIDAVGDKCVAMGQLREFGDQGLTTWVQAGGQTLLPGAKVVVHAASQTGLYTIRGRVDKADNGMFKIDAVGGVDRIQRRNFARVRLNHVLRTATVLDGRGQPVDEIQIFLTDLSAGGARFEGTDRLPNIAQVKFEIPIDQGAPIPVICEVMDTNVEVLGKAGDREILKVTSRGFFRDLDERTQERLMQFVFRRQLQSRRRQD